MTRALRGGSAIALAVLLAGCGAQTTQANAGNTRADSAHVAAQAGEPRTSDPTAAAAATASPTPSTAVTVSGSPAPAPAAAPEPAGSASEPRTRRRPASAQGAPKKISARHVLIQWMGSDRAGKSVLRTREQARVLAEEVLKRARAGEDLGRLAVEYSDEPNADTRGGSLGRFGKGQMVGAFEQVAFGLEVGDISDIVETPFGFHIIQRTE